MRILILLSILSINITASSQDSVNKKPGTIYKVFSGWKMDGRRLNGRDLKEEIYKAPEAIPYYKKFKTRQIIGYSLGTPGAILTIIRLVNERKTVYTPSKQNGLTIAATALLFGSGIWLLSSNKQLRKAIRLYNKNSVTIY